jgi:hypothetical protein
MGEVVRFVPKSELERARLIREARAIYESIFPDAEGTRQPKHGYLVSGGDKINPKICTIITPTTHIVESIQGTQTWNEPNVSVGSN